MRCCKKFLICSLIFVFIFNGLIFSSVQQAKAYTYPHGAQTNPGFAIPASYEHTIQGRWTLNFLKIWTDVLNHPAYAIDSAGVEVKFLVKIDGNALNEVSDDVKDGASPAPALNTKSTPYSDQNYKGFNYGNGFSGEVNETKKTGINYKNPFAIFANVTDQKVFDLFLIDNSTIPNVDKNKAKTHTYSLQALIRVQQYIGSTFNPSVDLVLPEITGKFSPGGETVAPTQTAAWYRDNYFGGGPANFFAGWNGKDFKGNGGTTLDPKNGYDAVIHIPGFSNDKFTRPPLDFTLKHIIHYGSLGLGISNEDELIFVAKNSNLSIWLNSGNPEQGRDCDINSGYNFAAITVTPGSQDTKNAISKDTGVNADFYADGPPIAFNLLESHKNDHKIAGTSYFTMLDKLYPINGKPGNYGPGKCPNSANMSDSAKELLSLDAQNAVGSESGPGTDRCSKNIFQTVSSPIANALCNMQLALIEWEASIINYIIVNFLFPSLGINATDVKYNPKL